MKVWNYLFISITMMLFLTFLGVNIGGFTQLMNLIGFGYDPTTNAMNVTTSASNIFNQLFGDGDVTGILVAFISAAGAVIVGLFAKARVENLILLPFITGTLTLFVEAFVSIMLLSIGTFPVWASAVILMVFLPFTVMYIVALAEFFRGTD